MTVGIHPVNLGNKWLDYLRGTSPTAPATVYVKLHTGDPGSAGTANASANTTRQALAWSAASANSIAISGSVTWAGWVSGTETETHLSVWDASTSGNFLYSFAATASKTVTNGDDLKLNSHSFSLTPTAA